VKFHGEIAWCGNARFDDDVGEPRPMWRVTATADVMIRLKRIFPRANKHRTGAITLVGTTEVARDLMWVCERWSFRMTDDDRGRLEEGARQHREREQTVHAILSGTGSLQGLMEPARPPRDYQTVAADLALTTGRLLLADELGLGKSMTGLMLLRAPEALPALVVCPTHLPRQWVSELAETFPQLRPHIVRTLAPYDPKDKREMGGHDPDVLVMNYAKLRGWGDHLAGQIRTVIFDEAQELRRADSDKWKAAARIADEAEYVMGLTATPVYNYGGEIHNIMRVLAPDALGSREEFTREWGGGGYWHDKLAVADPGALGTYLRDQGLMLRRTRKDVGRELPDVVRVPHSIDSDEETLDRLTGDAIDLAHLIVERSATRQELWKASGDFDWRMRHATGLAKAPYVADFVRMLLETDEPVVLFGWHRAVYDVWKERLADHRPVFYTGEESPNQKEAAKRAFLGDTDTPPTTNLLVMSLRAGAGLDGLQQRAHIAVFGELDWSPGMHDQCIGRLHRDGQDDPVVAYFLVSDQGADPVMAEVLNLKRQQADPIIDPDREPLAAAAGADDRVRRLAEDVLAKRRADGRLAA
jgi:SNF2 family DNA or RNA helicase